MQTSFHHSRRTKPRYELDYGSNYWERVDTFMKMTQMDPDTGAILLWKQGTPGTRLGDAFQNVSMEPKPGVKSLEEVSLDGLKEILQKYFYPGFYVQLEKSLQQYHTATRAFKEDVPCFITRLEIVERYVHRKDKHTVASAYLRVSVLLNGAGLSRSQREDIHKHLRRNNKERTDYEAIKEYMRSEFGRQHEFDA